MPQGGKYLRCDICEKPENDFSVNLPWNQCGELYEAAKAAGWMIILSGQGLHKDKHVCPMCANKPE